MEKIQIGYLFILHGKNWKITSHGIENWWGATCISSQAFASFTTEQIFNF